MELFPWFLELAILLDFMLLAEGTMKTESFSPRRAPFVIGALETMTRRALRSRAIL